MIHMLPSFQQLLPHLTKYFFIPFNYRQKTIFDHQIYACSPSFTIIRRINGVARNVRMLFSAGAGGRVPTWC